MADVFKEMESEDFLMSYLLNVEDEKETAYGQFVEDYTTTKEPLMGYESKQKWLDEFSGLKNLFVLVGGTLSVVIGVIEMCIRDRCNERHCCKSAARCAGRLEAGTKTYAL